MAEAIEVTARGLQFGAVYALLAMGMALIFSVAKVLNFAHGHMFMIATVVVWWCWQARDVPLWATLLLALVAVAVVSFVEERLVIRPTSRHGAIGWVLSTLGAATILSWVGEEILDHQPQTISFYFAQGSFTMFGARISSYLSIVVGIAVVIGLGVVVFLRRTFLGQAVMATAQNREAAELRGVDVARVTTFAFVLASVLAGVAGFLMAPYTFAEANVGLPYVLKAFVAAVIGGLAGRRIIEGALLGGAFLGVAEEWAGHLAGFDYRDTIVVLLLVVAMLLRPQGLLGRRERAV